jgi:putative membrane protein
MGVGMILFWGLIIAGVIAVVRYIGHTGERRVSSVGGGQRDPEQILAERFARGEIDEDDYRQRRELLRGGR